MVKKLFTGEGHGDNEQGGKSCNKIGCCWRSSRSNDFVRSCIPNLNRFDI